MNHFFKTFILLFLLSTQVGAQITVEYNGASATVNIPESVTGVVSSVNGSNVTLFSSNTTDEYTYTVSGYSADGSLSIRGSYKLTLCLNSIDLTNNHGGAAIEVSCGKRIAVVLADGTVNTLSDGNLNTSANAAFYFTGHPEFEGGGTLNVRGKAKHAIASKEYMELKSTTGTINILEAIGDGIHCGKGKVNNEHNYFQMKGGTVNIMNIGDDGIDADDFGVIYIKGGSLNINVPDDAKGLKADSILNISGGDINIVVKGVDSNALHANYAVNISGGNLDITLEGDGTKAISSNNKTASTVNNGGDTNISGGVINILALGDNYVNEANETQECLGASIDGNLNLSGGELHITAMGEMAKAMEVKGTQTITDNTLFITLSPWKVNPHDYLYDMTVYCIVKLNDMAMDDYAHKAICAFNGNQCIGIACFDTNEFGTMRLYSNTATFNQEISFKIHDYDADYEYELTPDCSVTFIPEMCVGLPSEPIVLGAEMDYYGDVNLDRSVDISDVVAIVNYILGNEPRIFEPLNADLDKSETIDISDVVNVVNVILSSEPPKIRIGPRSNI